jgi:hypothetical protein
VMRVPDVLAICPDIILVRQRPDLIRRAHLTLLTEIESEIPNYDKYRQVGQCPAICFRWTCSSDALPSSRPSALRSLGAD